MSRRLRWFVKKRGHRQTGSPVLGRLGLAAFFGAFFAGGWLLLIFLVVVYLLPDVRVNRRFIPGQCTILDSRVRERPGENGVLYRPEIQVRLEVAGKSYVAWTFDILALQDEGYSPGRDEKQELLDEYRPGESLHCWYDVGDPQRVVLVRGYTWSVWGMLIVPVTFIIVGGRGLGYWMFDTGKSAERRAAIAQQTQQAMLVDLFDQSSATGARFPNVPSDQDLTNSPGVRLAYRLPMELSPGWPLIILGVATLLWNAMVAVFLTLAVRRHFIQSPDWSLTALVIPCAAVGAGLVHFFFRQLVQHAGIGPTLVEVSEHELFPGKTFRVSVSQAGRLTMHQFELLLVCEERATYQQGTNTRSDLQRVYQRRVFRREHFEIHAEEPYELQTDLRIPPSAMHSFQAKHNQVVWKLVVRGEAAGWPRYERAFPIVVYPGPVGAVRA